MTILEFIDSHPVLTFLGAALVLTFLANVWEEGMKTLRQRKKGGS